VEKTKKAKCNYDTGDGRCSRPKGHSGYHAVKTTGAAYGGQPKKSRSTTQKKNKTVKNKRFSDALRSIF